MTTDRHIPEIRYLRVGSEGSAKSLAEFRREGGNPEGEQLFCGETKNCPAHVHVTSRGKRAGGIGRKKTFISSDPGHKAQHNHSPRHEPSRSRGSLTVQQALADPRAGIALALDGPVGKENEAPKPRITKTRGQIATVPNWKRRGIRYASIATHSITDIFKEAARIIEGGGKHKLNTAFRQQALPWDSFTVGEDTNKQRKLMNHLVAKAQKAAPNQHTVYGPPVMGVLRPRDFSEQENPAWVQSDDIEMEHNDHATLLMRQGITIAPRSGISPDEIYNNGVGVIFVARPFGNVKKILDALEKYETVGDEDRHVIGLGFEITSRTQFLPLPDQPEPPVPAIPVRQEISGQTAWDFQQ